MNICEPAIRRPVGTTLLAIGLLLVGAVAYRFLPVASMPTVDFPTISVTASRPGRRPGDHGGRRSRRRSSAGSAKFPGVTEMTSRSSLGSTRISIQFDLNRNIDGAARDVQAALNAALTDLPGDLQSRPSFRKSNPAATPIMILALTSRTVPPSAIYDAADTVVAQRLSQVDGVAEVSVNGAEQPAIRVRVNPIALASMGLSHGGRAHRDRQRQCGRARSACSTATAARSRSAPTISCAPPRNTTRWWCAPPTARWCGFPPSPRSSRACATAARSAGTTGQPSVLLVITKAADSNVIETVDRIRELMPEIKRWIPADIDISVLSDRTGTDPRQRRRHAAHAAGDHLPGDDGGVRVPAARGRDDRGRRHGAAGARRHLRDDVGGGLLDRQPVADGARGLGRLRGRRRHRHDRELLPQSRKGHVADAGGARRRAPDRLHRDLDQHFAGRRLHPAAVHERRRRPRVPRILGDARLRDRGLDRGVADADADDLRAFRAQAAEPGRDLARPPGRTRHGAG